MSTVLRGRAPDLTRVQRRTVALLVTTQVLAGVGVSIGMSVGVLLLARIAGGPGLSGLAQSAVAVGGALLAIPVTRLMQLRGRRPGLALAYLAGTAGGLLVIAAAALGSVVLALVGMFLFGGGITSNLQARYAAVDLADPARRGRQLSIVVWATTVGAVAGPNLAAPADRLTQPYGLPVLSGPFAFSVAAFLLAAVLLLVLLRPDPLLLSRRSPTPDASPPPGPASAGDAGPPATGDAVPLPAEATTTPSTAEAARLSGDAGVPDGTDAGASGIAPGPGEGGSAAPGTAGRARGPMATGWAAIRGSHTALLGFGAVASGHAVMLAVMVMTPIHIDEVLSNGHGHTDVLAVVGVVISLHVAGMYAFSPLVGYLADRYGRQRVILTGALLLVLACLLAGTSGADTVRLTAGLFLVGLGWSCTMVAGSTLLTESVPAGVRPPAQGFSDLVMGLAGALAGALSGVVVAWAGYPALALGSALLAVPLAVAAWRPGLAGRRAST